MQCMNSEHLSSLIWFDIDIFPIEINIKFEQMKRKKKEKKKVICLKCTNIVFLFKSWWWWCFSFLFITLIKQFNGEGLLTINWD